MKFVNEAKPRSVDPHEYRVGAYVHDRPSPYLITWSRLFQAVISQSASYMLSGSYHDQDCGIYKAEGGCSVKGVGGLVLCEDACRFDHDDKSTKKHGQKMAILISTVVCGWDPMDPIESMLNLAVRVVNGETKKGTPQTTVDDLLAACNKSGRYMNNPFGGNALSYFFGWNHPRVVEDPKYTAWAKKWAEDKAKEIEAAEQKV